jgi:hypothetical protein
MEDSPCIYLSTEFLQKDLWGLRGSRISVFIAIALHMNAENIAVVSIDQISQETAYSRRKVIAAISDLVKSGLVTPEINGTEPFFIVNPEYAKPKL